MSAGGGEAASVREQAGALGISPAEAERLELYLALLLKWNARMNLTAVRRPEAIIERHLAEGIFLARQIPSDVKTLLDFGSGAGLPGIPVAVCRPEIAVTLAESQGKKAAFLREAVRSLELRAEVWDGRVEQMPAGRVFDGVTLRAVDRMAEACQAAVARVADGGWIGIFATPKTEGSLEGLAGIRWTERLALPGSEGSCVRTGRRSG